MELYILNLSLEWKFEKRNKSTLITNSVVKGRNVKCTALCVSKRGNENA